MSVSEYIQTNFGNALDALVTLDIRAQGVIPQLYREARRIYQQPLALSSAASLVRSVRPGSTVLLCTGFCCPPEGLAETDGPIGAVLLARTLELALGCHPVLLSEEELLEPLGKMSLCVGLHPYIGDTQRRLAEHSTRVLSFTKDPDLAREDASKLLRKWDPAAIVSVERPGRNRRGIYHMGNGIDVSEYAAKIDEVFELSQGQIPRIGIGDLGNELGMGGLAAAVREGVLYGEKCQCECGEGIACEIEADNVIVSSVSDWGAYALAAAVAFLVGKPEALHGPDLEERTLQVGVEAGLVDGPSRYHIPWLDGMHTDTHRHVVSMLGKLVHYADVFPKRSPAFYEEYASRNRA